MHSKLLRHLNLAFVSTRAPEREEHLLSSLRSATITRVEWDGRPSRSGLTYYVRRIKAELETGKHRHQLSCWSFEGKLLCDWIADGEDIATIELEPGDKLYRDLMNIVGMALRMKKVEENVVELKPRPVVVPY